MVKKPTKPAGKYNVEFVPIEKLKQHPKNYKEHPEDQLKHIIKSIEDFGVYKNLIIAKDNTILAGHGVYKAAVIKKLKELPCIRINLDPESSAAIKIVVGDNEIGRLADTNDRLLTDILKDIKDNDIDGLLGTGFDDMMLANLLFITRHENEIKNINEAAEWVGMPDYNEGEKPYQININFKTDDDRKAFVEQTKLTFTKQNMESTTWSAWWPDRERRDISSIKFE